MASDFEVREAGDADVDGVLQALTDGYGRPFTPQWFEWKHRASPWGPSRCYTALDEGGLLGVVFALPWPMLDDDQPTQLVRLVDGATTVRSQRRGVFRAVVRQLLDDAGVGGEGANSGGLALATATPEARAAHVKNGATALESIGAFYRPVRWAPATLVDGDHLLDSYRTSGGGLRTRWDAASLLWRLDPRSGATSTVSALAGADTAHGVVHRVVGRTGRRVLVVVAAWGPSATVDRAVRAIAWREKAVAVLQNCGPGTDRRAPRLAMRRGSSLMCVWDDRAGRSPALQRERWHLNGLDIEGAI